MCTQPKRRPSELMVLDIAEALADYDPVLWGDYLLTIYGIPLAVNNADFLVPREHLEKAIAALAKMGIHDCRRVCPWRPDNTQRLLVITPFHAHLADSSTISLSFLWRHNCGRIRPSLETSLSTSSADVITATDPSLPRSANPMRGKGALPPSKRQVLIPKPERYTEHLIWHLDLMNRRGHGNMRIMECRVVGKLAEITKYVLGGGLFGIGDVSEPWRGFLGRFASLEGGDTDYRVLLGEWRKTL